MSEEYCVGVKILLERMDTNPEEFIAPFNQIKGARWSNLMSGIIAHKLEKDVRGDANFLTDTEVDAVFDKYKVLRRKAFDDHILREVLGADEQLSYKDAVQAGKHILRTGASHNNINQMQGWSDPSIYSNAAQAQAQNMAAQQQALGLMNAYPYQSSQDLHPQPMPEGVLRKMAKGLGLK
jgi:hypothetical protein